MSNFTPLSIANKELITLDADKNVLEAHQLMQQKKIRHLVVTSDGKAVGILSSRDVARILHVHIEDVYSTKVKHETANTQLHVRDIMSWPIVSASEDAALPEVIDKMLNDKISSILVTDKSQYVVGIITTDDLLRVLKIHLTEEHKSFWGDAVNQAYATPIRSVLEALSNSGI